MPLTQIRDADRLSQITPERWRAYSPFGITVRSGDLSTRSDRAEYLHNVYGSWSRRDRYGFGDDY